MPEALLAFASESVWEMMWCQKVSALKHAARGNARRSSIPQMQAFTPRLECHTAMVSSNLFFIPQTYSASWWLPIITSVLFQNKTLVDWSPNFANYALFLLHCIFVVLILVSSCFSCLALTGQSHLPSEQPVNIWYNSYPRVLLSKFPGKQAKSVLSSFSKELLNWTLSRANWSTRPPTVSFYYIEKCKHVHRVASCWIFLSNIGSQCSCETFKVKDIPVKQSSLQEAWSTTSLLHSIAGLSLIYSAAYKKPHRWPFFFFLCRRLGLWPFVNSPGYRRAKLFVGT